MENLTTEMRGNMQKTLDNLKSQFNTLRTGRANPTILDRIEIDYYGTKTPLRHIAMISVPEAQQLVVKPYDKGDVRSIAAALNASDLGINPISEGDQVRLIFPIPTVDRRRELVKTAKKYGEEAKVAIRNIRRDFMDLVKMEEGLSEDYQKRLESDIQDVTNEMIKLVDEACKTKESEIMTI